MLLKFKSNSHFLLFLFYESQSQCTKSHFPASKKGKSQPLHDPHHKHDRNKSTFKSIQYQNISTRENCPGYLKNKFALLTNLFPCVCVYCVIPNFKFVADTLRNSENRSQRNKNQILTSDYEGPSWSKCRYRGHKRSLNQRWLSNQKSS